MTILAIFLLGASASLALLVAVGSWLGRCIKFGNEIDEHALPFEPDALPQPYTNRSTLVALPRSGRVFDSEA